ncbi:hypothetical protein [Rhodococcus sp. BH5]|uniref:hypothetical protein n=1 Tax=Rhodococcus sp. BH5 TaxID=2871702 RepID=UPI0022CD315E|nr:hypothetical protein [Rhodococcus sp. BH5]MCZ9635003.1 hypothetical protein [Rhodococcus sp. BH5]
MLNTSTLLAPIVAGIVANGFNALRYRKVLRRYRADIAAKLPSAYTSEYDVESTFFHRGEQQARTALLCAAAVAIAPGVEWVLHPLLR